MRLIARLDFYCGDPDDESLITVKRNIGHLDDVIVFANELRGIVDGMERLDNALVGIKIPLADKVEFIDD